MQTMTAMVTKVSDIQVKVTTVSRVVPESNRLSRCVVRLSLPIDYRPMTI